MTRQKNPAVSDPYFERESQKYERPIPSRELILEVLTQNAGPLPFSPLAAALGLTEDVDLEALSRRLRAMERDGQILRNRRDAYLPVREADLIRGRIIGHPDGFGFLVPDDGGEDLFMSPKEMRSLFHGDRAVARVIGVDRRGRKEGALVEVLERGTEQVVGRYLEESGIGIVAPDNKRIVHDLLIPPEHRGRARPGQIVVAQIVEQPTRRTQPIGRIVEVLGEHMAPGMEIDVAIRSYGLPHQWPEAVTEEADRLGHAVPEAAKKGRLDLRELPLVTIDGADARDFDDAVYCERRNRTWRSRGGWRLFVAIADVSYYVKPGSALDQEAHHRGTSVYFPERVIPMLPEILSNGLCSINPQVDRLCIVCEMQIDEKGVIKKFEFHEALMRSHARLTYDQVAAMVVDGDPTLRRQHEALVPHLEALYALYKVLRKERDRRGAIDFESTETKIAFGPDRKIERIVPVQRNDAHKIIEECMIAANVCAAKFLKKHKMPTLHRVHPAPKLDKIETLREFLGQVGLSLGGGEEPAPKDYAKLIAQVQGRPDAHLIQTVLLRSLAQAVYSPEDFGHFGLAQEDYAHFTSPIRRYPDLLVHRAIRHILQGGKTKTFAYSYDDMVNLGGHCSMTERRADEATRDAVDWLKCEYMLDKLGQDFDGIISSVTSFGLFVELKDIYVEGLIHISTMENDYYRFDPVGHRLYGERSGEVFRLGDALRVKVARVDLDERKIDFQLIGSAAAAKGRGGRRGEAGKKSTAPAQDGPSAKKRGGRGRGRGKSAAKTQGAKGEGAGKTADERGKGKSRRGGRKRKG